MNHLSREKSPYLLQHRHNPVDWYAWGAEAFTRARTENRPIFLSIGYSTCHWCHVMERESFENADVAAFLNAHFVSIKVDREERPDVDRVYMTYVQATVGSGGWPLNVFLTPDLKPFYGGTYFPPANRYGQPGFMAVLETVAAAWHNRLADVLEMAGATHRQLQAHLATRAEPAAEALDPLLLDRALAALQAGYDRKHGGWGDAPKFPTPSLPAFLLRYGVAHRSEPAVAMVLHCCDCMAAGGIHDHLGGGFARYAVDAAWIVPHFEKMLYDNAQLAALYLDAFLVSREPRHAATARDIFDYVRRDLTHPDGGFYSAEDADSEGHEGKFYCWTRQELETLLTPAEFALAVRRFGITENGNFRDHSHPQPLPGQNVLHLADSALSEPESRLLPAIHAKLFAARTKRVRPHCDDKILASWNGMMIGAFARGYAVLRDPAYRQAAERALDFIRQRLWEPATGTLHHRWRDGEHDRTQLLSGYAFLLNGVLDLYEATLQADVLAFACALAETLLHRLYDRENGGFWQSDAGPEELIFRVKDDYDGAEPAGNSVAALALLRLGAITGRTDFRQAADATLRLYAGRLAEAAPGMAAMLQALAFALAEPCRIVIAGDPALPECRELLAAAHRSFHPHKVVLGNRGPVDPFAAALPAGNGPTAYVCAGTACQPPTRDPAALAAMLLVPADPAPAAPCRSTAS